MFQKLPQNMFLHSVKYLMFSLGKPYNCAYVYPYIKFPQGHNLCSGKCLMFSVFNLKSYIYSLATRSSKITVGALLTVLDSNFTYNV